MTVYFVQYFYTSTACVGLHVYERILNVKVFTYVSSSHIRSTYAYVIVFEFDM